MFTSVSPTTTFCWQTLLFMVVPSPPGSKQHLLRSGAASNPMLGTRQFTGQRSDNMHPVRDFYHSVLCKTFPPVRFAFAYGSAVFQQYERPKGKMLDLVFAVDDPQEWHKENMSLHPHHYSFLRHLGPRGVTRIQHYPAGVYYNTLVHVRCQLLKYGVMSTKDLIDDLTTWRWLYISGRLHKPVVILTDQRMSSHDLNHLEPGGDTLDLPKALGYNLKSAVLCAALLLQRNQPNECGFTDEELYMTIAALSYSGDFRMVVGEDKDKIRNVVKPFVEEFGHLYRGFLDEVAVRRNDGRLAVRPGVTLEGSLPDLPLCVAEGVAKGKSLKKVLSRIVFASSLQQSMKGVFTAGLRKTVVYSTEKLVKMIRSIMS